MKLPCNKAVKCSLLIVTILTIITICSAVYAVLSWPSEESGWKRWDLNPSTCNTNWTNTAYASSYGDGFFLCTNTQGAYINFYFNGGKIRITGNNDLAYSSDINIIIDGTTYTVSEHYTHGEYPIVVFEKTDLSDGWHSCQIINNLAALAWIETADVDTGCQILISSPTPTITSTPTNTPTTTPLPTVTPVPGGDRAILTITLSNDTEKEYDMTAQEIADFKTWYSSRAAGTGEAFYEIDKTYNKGPFINRKDCIVFDKIVSFEISDYNSN